MLQGIWHRHRIHWSERRMVISTFYSIVLFCVTSFVIFPYSIQFADQHAGGGVPDLILSNTPVYNVGDPFVYGVFFLIAFIVGLCVMHPKRTPFVLNALSVFILIRSIFVTLTHIGPFATQAVSDFGPAITKAFFGNDFFFSGHTGIPFMMALMFWDDKILRYIFLTWSVFFGVIVLLGHLHYSIDVLSAFFITYAIYHISLYLFPNARALFLSQPV
jgi:hypothetical protein